VRGLAERIARSGPDSLPQPWIAEDLAEKTKFAAVFLGPSHSTSLALE